MRNRGRGPASPEAGRMGQDVRGEWGGDSRG